ncbi:MAG: DNA-directed RNA polymerase subunit K [Candidatus Micrarchaeia archaeon]|jgi:DNA-directed RNA polymerase subunit K/omega
MTKKEKQVFTKYEVARLIGARARQLAMGAPPLVKATSGVANALQLAMLEFEKGAIPLHVVRRV